MKYEKKIDLKKTINFRRMIALYVTLIIFFILTLIAILKGISLSEIAWVISSIQPIVMTYLGAETYAEIKNNENVKSN